MWENLFLIGKELRLSITINYIEDNNSLATTTDKRGNTSRTKRMLGERDVEIDAEKFSSGQPDTWRRADDALPWPTV
jgi:hypothetical protein